MRFHEVFHPRTSFTMGSKNLLFQVLDPTIKGVRTYEFVGFGDTGKAYTAIT